MGTDIGRASCVTCQLRTWTTDRSADHVPNDDPVDPLRPVDDLGAQAGVNSGPGVVSRVGTRIRADAPDYELVCMRRPFEYVGVVSVKTPLQFDDGRSFGRETDHIVMPIVFPGRLPLVDESLVLHEVEDMPHEVALFLHRSRKLPAKAFDGTPEQTAAVELRLAETMVAERVRLGLQDFGECLDPPAKLAIPLARDDAHAAFLISLECSRTGSMTASAKKRTTGTATPSPVR